MSSSSDQASLSSEGKLKKKTPKIFFIGIIAALIMIAGSAFAIFWLNNNQSSTNTDTPKSLSKRFVNLFQASDSVAAYELFTDEWKKDVKLEYLNNNLIEPWARVATGSAVLSSNATKTINGKETEIYVYEIPNKSNDKKYYVKIGMVKLDNKWQVSSLGILTDKIDAKD